MMTLTPTEANLLINMIDIAIDRWREDIKTCQQEAAHYHNMDRLIAQWHLQIEQAYKVRVKVESQLYKDQ